MCSIEAWLTDPRAAGTLWAMRYDFPQVLPVEGIILLFDTFDAKTFAKEKIWSTETNAINKLCP